MFWMWKVIFFLGMIIPFHFHTHLFILFSYLFTNLHDLSLSNLHLTTYNLHPYYIYKYTFLTHIFTSYNSKRIDSYFLPSFPILSSSLFSLPYTLRLFISSLNPTLTESPFSSSHLCFIFPFLFSYFVQIYTLLISNK